MLDKTKVSRLVKTHILFFMTLPLFARFLRDTLSISFKMRKKGKGTKKKCVILSYAKLLFYQTYAKNVRVPSNPPPLHETLEMTHHLYELQKISYLDLDSCYMI